MKPTDIQSELSNYKIRQGFLLKRSRVWREWRKRWMVLTVNFLFSFEDETCSKSTQIIDLKQIISFRSILKSEMETEPNCFYIQTKMTDFAFSASEISQRWSWIVTLERLFDFKEKGASSYNNIDMIKSQGFESQNEYAFNQKSNIKTIHRNGKTIGIEEQQRRKHVLLKVLQKKQEQLKIREQKLKEQEKICELMRVSNKNFALQIKELNTQIRQLQEQSCYLKEEALAQQKQFLRRESENIKDMLEEEKIQNLKGNKLQGIEMRDSSLSADHILVKEKTIKYLFQNFHDFSDGLELVLMVDFFLKIAEKEEYSYRAIIEKEIEKTKYLEFFLNVFFQVIKLKYQTSPQNIHQILAFMKILFKNHEVVDEKYLLEAEKIIAEWSLSENVDTPSSTVEETIDVLNLLTKNRQNNSEETEKSKKYLIQLKKQRLLREKPVSISVEK